MFLQTSRLGWFKQSCSSPTTPQPRLHTGKRWWPGASVTPSFLKTTSSSPKTADIKSLHATLKGIFKPGTNLGSLTN